MANERDEMILRAARFYALDVERDDTRTVQEWMADFALSEMRRGGWVDGNTPDETGEYVCKVRQSDGVFSWHDSFDTGDMSWNELQGKEDCILAYFKVSDYQREGE